MAEIAGLHTARDFAGCSNQVPAPRHGENECLCANAKLYEKKNILATRGDAVEDSHTLGCLYLSFIIGVRVLLYQILSLCNGTVMLHL